MWTVLFHVNPTTVTAALALCLLTALAFAWWRRPDPQRLQGAMRKLLALSTAVYLAILLAPASALEFSEGNTRTVVWDPMQSFEEVAGIGLAEEFGLTLEDDRAVHYAPEGAATEERSDYDFLTQDGPDGTLVVTDSAGGTPTPEDAALAKGAVEEELARQADYTAQIEAEGPWGTTGGLALQERVLNTLLFVPIGVVAFFALSSWTARLLFGPALSLTVEAAQWALRWGGLADTGDLLVNSAGSLVGTLMAVLAVGAVAALRPAPTTQKEETENQLSPARG